MDLQALADGEPLGARESDVLTHVRTCVECQHTIAEMRAAHERDEEFLSLIDRGLPTANVNAVIARAAARRSTRGIRGAIAAGIGILIVSAAAVAAVPGSPVRAYVEHLFAHTRDSAATMPPLVTQSPIAPRETPDVGVSFPASSRVEIVFSRAGVQGRVRVTIVDTPMVRVTNHGGTAAYRLTLHGVTIDSVGSNATFEVMLPSTTGHAVVRVDGRTVFTKNGTRIRTTGALDSTGAYVIPFGATR
jgi:hypothetical protein